MRIVIESDGTHLGTEAREVGGDRLTDIIGIMVQAEAGRTELFQASLTRIAERHPLTDEPRIETVPVTVRAFMVEVTE